jgi:hypothetical protein
MGIERFNRDFSISIGTIKIAARAAEESKTGESASTVTYVARPTLRCAFMAEKTNEPKPNKAKVSVWNLSETSRSSLQEKRVPILVEAGYVGNTATIFAGKLLVSKHVRNGPDWVSEFESGDGSVEYSAKRLRESFKPGVKIEQIMKRVAGEMGIGVGNSLKKISEGNFRGGLQEFTKGIALNGRCSDLFDDLMSSAGFEWSIQDEQLLVLRPDETTEDTAIELTSDTGLIGSPVVGEKGILTATSLLDPTLNPGRKLRILTAEVDGFYKTTRVKHIGDTASDQPWYSEFEAKPI